MACNCIYGLIQKCIDFMLDFVNSVALTLKRNGVVGVGVLCNLQLNL